jgi:transporter family-2 protein
MNGTTLVYSLLAAGAGACIALQASANGKFRQNLALSPPTAAPDYLGPAWAAFLSICGTMTCALVAMAVLRPPPPSPEAFRGTQWWNWVGGPLGAVIVLAGAALAPRLGAAAFIALVVGGQLLCSLVLDHYGLMGLAVQAITPGRVLGAVLVVAGVVCIKFL